MRSFRELLGGGMYGATPKFVRRPCDTEFQGTPVDQIFPRPHSGRVRQASTPFAPAPGLSATRVRLHRNATEIKATLLATGAHTLAADVPCSEKAATLGEAPARFNV